MSHGTFRSLVVNGLVLSGLSIMAIAGILIFYQNSQKSDSMPSIASSNVISADNPEEYEPIPLRPLEEQPIDPPPPSSSSVEPKETLSDQWSILLPDESVLIAKHDRLMAGLEPQLDDRSPPQLSPSSSRVEPVTSLSATVPTRIEYLPSSRVKSATKEVALLPTSDPLKLTQSSASEEILNPVLSPEATPNNSQPFQPSELPLSPASKPSATASPSTAIMIPSAYGQTWGKVGIGLGVQSRTRYTDKADGGIGIGIGLGNPQNSVGIDVGISILDLIGNTGEDGSISVKLHRQLPENWAIAVGVNNAIQWGNTDGGSSVYGVISKRFDLREQESSPFSRVYASVGVGGGQFRSEDHILTEKGSVGVFAGVAVRVIPSVNAIAEWTGQDLTLGVSVTPIPNIPLIITPALTDITGNAGDGSRLILGVGYVISF